MKLAVIPARGGSKRIPRKNIRPFGGLPMIGWSIRAAQQSGCFDDIIISTDDDEIAEVAHAHGARVPFLRPAELADDHTGTMPVIAHAIQAVEAAGQSPEFVCCIYATAPFLQPTDLQRGLETLQQDAVDYAFSVTSFAFPIQRAIRITGDQRIEMFQPAEFQTRSQDLEPAYHDAGQFYWGRRDAWLAETPIFAGNSAPIILPRHRVQDIDSEEDWYRAELMFRALNMADRGD